MKLYFFLFSLLLIFLNCKKNNNDGAPLKTVSMDISPASLEMNYGSSSQTLSVTADAEWGVSSSQSWCKINPIGGISGTTALTVTSSENTGDSSRTAILTLKSGSFKKEISVLQHYHVKEVEFTDATFKKYCIDHFDTNKDGLFSKSEAASVKELTIQGLGIASLVGIDCFTALSVFNCNNNNLTTIDLSKLSAITTLNCSGNQLSTLDIQVNTNLKSLDCTGNPSLASIFVWTGFTAGSTFQKPDGASYVEPAVATPSGYKLVWQDEFNTSRTESGKAALPNTNEWGYDTGAGGWGNNEIENYIPGFTGSDTCAMIYNGTLKIVAKKVGSQVYSIRMNTSKSWTYGYFEARLKLPGGKGSWPAFWMMPKNFTAWPDDGEIDIMEEVGFRPNYVSSSIHCKAYYHSIGTQKTAETYVSTAESDFHIYAVEWTADQITGYVDGKKYFEFDNDHANNYNTWPFSKPFYLKLNLAWGGDWGGAQGVNQSALPLTYEVDYVRVFQKSN
jgi:beta-glucanase (GH16 family)